MEILEKYKIYKQLDKEIADIIGYPSELDSTFEFLPDSKWYTEQDEVWIEIEGDEYVFTMSSYGNLREKFFIGDKEGLTLIMAYADNWDQTTLFILKSENQVENG